MSIKSVMPSSHLILCRPLLLLPPVPPSIRVFSDESALRMRWPKYWSFSFSISPSNEHPGRISFRRDWLDLLAVQGTLKSLLQHCYIYIKTYFSINIWAPLVAEMVKNLPAMQETHQVSTDICSLDTDKSKYRWTSKNTDRYDCRYLN